jgi:hypothetical protein
MHGTPQHIAYVGKKPHKTNSQNNHCDRIQNKRATYSKHPFTDTCRLGRKRLEQMSFRPEGPSYDMGLQGHLRRVTAPKTL